MTRAKKPSPDAATEVVASAAKTWSDQVLKCRLLGHSWAQYRAEHMLHYHYWHVVFRCERGCGVERWEEWTERGMVTAKGMKYPRSERGESLYLLEGFGRVNAEGRGSLRLESVGRTKYYEIEGGEDVPENAPHSTTTVKKLKENKQWPSN